MWVGGRCGGGRDLGGAAKAAVVSDSEDLPDNDNCNDDSGNVADADIPEGGASNRPTTKLRQYSSLTFKALAPPRSGCS